MGDGRAESFHLSFLIQRKVTEKIFIVTKMEQKKTGTKNGNALDGYEVRIEEDILDAEKVASILNSSKKVIERELREGKLIGHKRLGKWFILKSELVAYIRRADNQEEASDE